MTNARPAIVAVLLALGACTGAAVAAELLLDDPATAVAPSRVPDVLGPITESGRTGWDCVPERAATARSARAAGLPND